MVERKSWHGYWTEGSDSISKSMTLELGIQAGVLAGEGSDGVGRFTVRGSEDAVSGRVTFTKQYAGRHAVRYEGVRLEGGIAGSWSLSGMRGLFALWPGLQTTPPAGLDPEGVRERCPEVDLGFVMIENPGGELLLRPPAPESRRKGQMRLVRSILMILVSLFLIVWHIGWGEFPGADTLMLIPVALLMVFAFFTLISAWMIFRQTETKFIPDPGVIRRETLGFWAAGIEERSFQALDRVCIQQFGKGPRGMWSVTLVLPPDAEWDLGFAFGRRAAEHAANRIADVTRSRVEAKPLS